MMPPYSTASRIHRKALGREHVLPDPFGGRLWIFAGQRRPNINSGQPLRTLGPHKLLHLSKGLLQGMLEKNTNCIEEIVTEQQSIFEYPRKIRTLADQYGRRIIRKQSVVIVPEKKRSPDYARVDLNSINNESPRTAGAEHVVYETIKLLEIDKKLIDLGLKPADIAAIIGVLCGRMIVPGSERATHYWLQNLSGLGELIDFDFSLVTLDRLYKASDHLLKHKEEIEDHLRKVEVRIFALEERIILYDLTNTFFDGTGKYNPKAKACKPSGSN